MFSCQNWAVLFLLLCLYFLVQEYPKYPPLLLMLFCCLLHIILCRLFRLPLGYFFPLYHWLCCRFICWFLLVCLWYLWPYYCLCQIDLILILHNHHILCLLYLWCRFRILSHLFQCFNLLVGLFDRVGLNTNTGKTVSMTCRPCTAEGDQLKEAYGCIPSLYDV